MVNNCVKCVINLSNKKTGLYFLISYGLVNCDIHLFSIEIVVYILHNTLQTNQSGQVIQTLICI